MIPPRATDRPSLQPRWRRVTLQAWVLALGLLLAACSSSPFRNLPECRPGTAPGSVGRAPLAALHPTQPCVGMREVAQREARLSSKKPKSFVRNLMEKPVEIVVGPEGALYVVDGHHLALAALRSGRTADIPALVRADWSRLSPNDFWARMQSENLVYLRDAAGQTITPAQLPSRLADLRDDPYRDLAWAVREKNGFDKTTAPFSEFRWADFFRTRISIPPGEDGFSQALSQALEWARSPEAAGLPGFHPK